MDEHCGHERSVVDDYGSLGRWSDVPRNEAAPFIHRFRTDSQTYVYDVNTRRILRVSRVVWDVLEDYGLCARDEIVRKHTAAHSAERVAAAIDEIESARSRGLMLSIRPRQVVLPDRQKLLRQLAEDREQLILNVTEDCNFRCSYCVYGGGHEHFRTHSKATMGWDVARKAIDDFLAHSGAVESPAISFYGGEPLLNLDLIRRCVEYARRERADDRVRFSMTTNGSLLTGKAADFLAEEGFAIVVSLDGPAEMHDRCRRTIAGEATWNRVVANVERFLADHPEYRTNGRLRFNSVLTHQSDLCEAEAYWSSSPTFTDAMGLEVSQEAEGGEPGPTPRDSVFVSSARALHGEFLESHKSGRYASEHQRRSRWMQSGLFQKSLLLFHKRGFVSPHLPETMPLMNTCVPGARRAFVSADGAYYACERVPQAEAQAIGDVAVGIDTEKVLGLLEEWAATAGDACRWCWCVSHCTSGCMATLGGDGQFSRESRARLCAASRQAMHRVLVEYVDICQENPRAFDYMESLELS